MSVSFASDVLPLFREVDIQHMKPFGVALDDYAYMSDPDSDDSFPDHAHARQVFCRLSGTDCGPQMPIGGPFWTADQLKTFEDWMKDGFLA